MCSLSIVDITDKCRIRSNSSHLPSMFPTDTFVPQSVLLLAASGGYRYTTAVGSRSLYSSRDKDLVFMVQRNASVERSHFTEVQLHSHFFREFVFVQNTSRVVYMHLLYITVNIRIIYKMK